MMADMWKYTLQMSYVTDSVADTLMFGIVVLLSVFVVSVWFRCRVLPKIIIVCVSLSIPLITTVLLLVPLAYQGTPDNNCAKYNSGRTVFVLEGVSVRPVKPSDPYGDEVLALLVRVAERWGDDLHLCVLPRNSEKAEIIIAFLLKFGFSPGVTTIVFGGEQEIPNVTWEPKEPVVFEKPGPPEVPIN